MRTRTTVLATLTALALSAALPTAPAMATTDTARTASTQGRPGDIVTKSPTSFRALPGAPVTTRSWHVTYRSTTARSTANTVSGTVIVPDDGKTGPRPLVTWGMGAVGLADSCAASGRFPQGPAPRAG